MHPCSGLGILIMAVYTTIRVRGNTLKEDSSDSITQWTIHHTSVTSYPTQVCHTPKDVSWVKVKRELHRKIACVHRTITIMPTLSAYTLCTIHLQSKIPSLKQCGMVAIMHVSSHKVVYAEFKTSSLKPKLSIPNLVWQLWKETI